jgi:hypothetical protein
MKSLAFLMALFICLFVVVITAIPDYQMRKMLKSCELVEISPDYTAQEKSDCRKMRMK